MGPVIFGGEWSNVLWEKSTKERAGRAGFLVKYSTCKSVAFKR